MSTDTPAPLRAVVYCRVSVDDFSKGKKSKEEQAEEASVSIEAQKREGQARAEHEGYELVGILVDDGVSGFKEVERKSFDKLLRLIVGGHVDVVIARAMDRIARNDEDSFVVRKSAREHNVIIQMSSGSLYDLSKSGDAFAVQMLQTVAQLESAQKSERLVSIYAAMRERGELRSGHKAFGWQWEKGKPELSMLAEPQERELVREAYSRLLSSPGETLYAVCADWNARGIPTVGKARRWSTQALRSVLLRPSNALFIRDGNGWDYLEGKRGKWDRLIDDETYLRTRALLLSPSRRTAPGRTNVHLVSGIVHCGLCGAPLRSSSVGDKKGGRVPIYRCVNKTGFPSDPGVKHVSARTEALDAAVRRAVIDAFVMGPANLFPDETPSRAAKLHSELDSLIGNRQKVLSLVAEGVVTPADIRSQLATLKNREAALRADLDEAYANDADTMRLSDLRAGLWHPSKHADIEAAAAYAAELGARFDALPIEKRRALVRYLLCIEVLPVAPGVEGSRRWNIVHRRATSLNSTREAQALAHVLQREAANASS